MGQLHLGSVDYRNAARSTLVVGLSDPENEASRIRMTDLEKLVAGLSKKTHDTKLTKRTESEIGWMAQLR